MRSCRIRSDSKMPLMPSPGRLKTVSTAPCDQTVNEKVCDCLCHDRLPTRYPVDRALDSRFDGSSFEFSRILDGIAGLIVIKVHIDGLECLLPSGECVQPTCAMSRSSSRPDISGPAHEAGHRQNRRSPRSVTEIRPVHRCRRRRHASPAPDTPPDVPSGIPEFKRVAMSLRQRLQKGREPSTLQDHRGGN